MDKNSTLAMIIAGVAGLVIGSIGTLAIQPKRTATPATDTLAHIERTLGTKTDSRAVNLRVDLLSHHQQYASRLLQTSRSLWNGQVDVSAAAKSTDAMTHTMASDIQNYYGAAAAGKYYAIWTSQSQFIVDYVKAVKAGDATKRDANLVNLNSFIPTLTDLFTSLDKDFQVVGLRTNLQTLNAQLRKSVDSYSTKDYTAAYQADQQVQQVMGRLTDQLTTEIIRQHPEKF